MTRRVPIALLLRDELSSHTPIHPTGSTPLHLELDGCILLLDHHVWWRHHLRVIALSRWWRHTYTVVCFVSWYSKWFAIRP